MSLYFYIYNILLETRNIFFCNQGLKNLLIIMKTLRIALLGLCLLMSQISTQPCSTPNPSTDLLDIGKVTLTRKSLPNREHCLPISIKYPMPSSRPDIALSISRFTGLIATNGYDFAINAARKGLSNDIVIVVQIDEDRRWINMEVTYLVSHNPNIIAGSFMANLVSLSGCVVGSGASNQTAGVEHYLPSNRVKQGVEYRVIAFISALRTPANRINLKPVSTQLDSNDNRLTIQIQSSVDPSIQYIYISYYILSPQDFQLTIFDGVNNRASTIPTYTIEGILGFIQNGGITYNQVNICKKQQQIGCINGEIYVNGNCVCPAGFVKVRDLCRQVCSQNAYVNDQKVCVCIDGFQFGANGMCQQIGTCRENQILLYNGQCGCQTGFQRNPQGICTQSPPQFCQGQNQVLQNGRCVCVNGYTRTGNACVPNCRADNNEIWNGNFCVCKDGYLYNQIKQCVAVRPVSCGQNQVLLGGICQCKSGFVRFANGVCSPNCSPGFVMSPLGFCTPMCTKQNQAFNPLQNRCDCLSGFVRVDTECTKNCNSGQYWDGAKCSCPSGMVFLNGACLRCPPNSTISPGAETCLCRSGLVFRTKPTLSCTVCPKSSIFLNNQCLCPQGLSWNSDQTACIRSTVCPQFASLNQNNICICDQGYRFSADGQTCLTLCPQNSVFNPQTGCTCNDGYEWNPRTAGCDKKQVLNCPANSNIVNGVCVCNVGFRFNAQGQCVGCPVNSVSQGAGVCVCGQGFQWSSDGQSCVRSTIKCPINSSINPSTNQCQCNPGYDFTPNRQNCIPLISCPQNAFIGPEGKCVCNNGLYLENFQCKVIPACPLRSVWDQGKLACVCSNPGEYLISGVCKPCRADENWNGVECACKDSLFRISGVCRPCHIFTTYNGTDCNCNLGYFGNRDNCQPCHDSCGTCTGPQANQCLTCKNINLKFDKGYCSKQTPCSKGFYQGADGTCAQCGDYCTECVNEQECGECAVGFQISVMIVDGVGYSACEGICGDGKRVDTEKCDDGNKVDGDGCSSTCKVQDNYFCSGGSVLTPSKCVTPIPATSKLTTKNSVNMIGKVAQGVRLSMIPKCYLDKNCEDCYRILEINVIDALVPISVSVSYIPDSNGQFLVQYDLGKSITNFFFKYQIKINNKMPCFTEADYAQQLTGTIDSTFLAIGDKQETLSLDSLLKPSGPQLPKKITDPNATVRVINGNNGDTVPLSLINKLFG